MISRAEALSKSPYFHVKIAILELPAFRASLPKVFHLDRLSFLIIYLVLIVAVKPLEMVAFPFISTFSL